ncbi:MAG: hybrid sensor histidine kinase/response regulator [Rhodospirillaceae bacterium]
MPDPVAPRPTTAPLRPGPPRPRATILIVDDGPANIELLKAILIRDYEIVATVDGRDGLALALDRRPDLILLDVMMPDMDGYQLCARLKADARTRDIPVIFVSGRTEEEDETKGLEAGAIDYIGKPIVPAIVRARVRNHLERRRAEAALRRAHDELEERVAERTRALTDEIAERKRIEHELLMAKNQAERASRAKTEFLSHMSHELRTPLNAIIGFSEFMGAETRGPVGSPIYLDYLGNITASGHHLLAVIDDILELAQLETGRLPLLEERIRLDEAVDGAIEGVRTTRRPPWASIVNTVGTGAPLLWADRRALAQMLRHLLDNAVKFTPHSGTITVSWTRTRDGGLEIDIADSGAGISPDRLGRLFEPFQPGNTMVARYNRGVGLGLPISYSLMRLHEGDITLTSAVGIGTRVSLRFPARRVIAGTG